MAFIIQNCIVEKIKDMKLNGIRIPIGYPDSYCEISIESRDTTDKFGNIKRIEWGTKEIAFGLQHDKRLVIRQNSDDYINLYIKCFAWTDRPHKSRRISKKWTKKYGKILRDYTLNWNMNGTWSIE